MSTRVRCTNCGKDLDIRGVRMHMATKHPEQNSTKYEQTSTNVSEQVSTNAIEQIAQLAEQTKLIEQNENSIAQLREEVTEKQTELEASQVRIAELQASLENVPTSIADFPAMEQAAYFTEFLINLSPEEKAVLAEETGFGIQQHSELLPPTETVSEQEEEVVPKTVLVIGKQKFVVRRASSPTSR